MYSGILCPIGILRVGLFVFLGMRASEIQCFLVLVVGIPISVVIIVESIVLGCRFACGMDDGTGYHCGLQCDMAPRGERHELCVVISPAVFTVPVPVEYKTEVWGDSDVG